MSLLENHQKGRSFIAGLKEAAEKDDKNGLIRNATGYSSLLKAHIETENRLFPSWFNEFSLEEKESLFDKFEEIEANVIGLGKHEEYKAKIEGLNSQVQPQVS